MRDLNPPNHELAEALAAALAAAVESSLEQLAAVHLVGAQPNAPAAQLDRWLSVAEVAELAGVSTRTVHRALRSGALLGDRIGGAGSRWHIRPEAVWEWLRPQTAGAPSRPARPATPPRAPGDTTRRRSFAERAQSMTRR